MRTATMILTLTGLLLLTALTGTGPAVATAGDTGLRDRPLEGYGTDPEMTAFVDGLETWFIPVVNVDGYRHVFSVPTSTPLSALSTITAPSVTGMQENTSPTKSS